MTPPLKQVAALPLVEMAEGPLVLLITTRGRGRWTIPKGWPKAGVPDAEIAAREAFEEAGVAGNIATWPIASFLYTKRLHLFSWVECSVDVYTLQVRSHELEWREKASRKLRWAAPDEAASLVGEAQLADVLRGFASRKVA
jgi:8-oxo-dGTP pyrophosphatase MutT (NUDIX family)